MKTPEQYAAEASRIIRLHALNDPECRAVRGGDVQELAKILAQKQAIRDESATYCRD